MPHRAAPRSCRGGQSRSTKCWHALFEPKTTSASAGTVERTPASNETAADAIARPYQLTTPQPGTGADTADGGTRRENASKIVGLRRALDIRLRPWVFRPDIGLLPRRFCCGL